MIEELLLSHLIYNDSFARKVLPFLKPEYFHNDAERQVFNIIQQYIEKYNALPTKEALFVDLKNTKSIKETVFDACLSKIQALTVETNTNEEWLLDRTEMFCKEKATHNALIESVQILNDSKQFDKGAIPKILQEALNVSFDQHIGHDFIEDYMDRFDFYNRVEEKLPSGILKLDQVMNGGPPRKTLNLLMATTGIGKSLMMCHLSAQNLLSGKNVLYITLELSQEKVAERIDANLLDIPISEISSISKEEYVSRFKNIKSKVTGKLIVKEYPTASAGANHFRFLLNELRLKKNFVPDVIYIDYLNLCMSSRIKIGAGANSYSYIKSIAEEIRGLAVEFNVPVWTATQGNRGGVNNSDIDIDNVSDSFGIAMTADFMIAIMSNDELRALGQYMFKQLKNRYGDPGRDKKFIVGVNYPKMRLENVDESEQTLIQDVSVMDNTNFGMADKFDHKKFKDWT